VSPFVINDKHFCKKLNFIPNNDLQPLFSYNLLRFGYYVSNINRVGPVGNSLQNALSAYYFQTPTPSLLPQSS